MFSNRLFLSLLFALSFTFSKAESSDSLVVKDSLVAPIIATTSDTVRTPNYDDKVYHFSYKKLIVPGVLITYGALTLTSDWLENLNFTTRDEIIEHSPKHITLDNYTQFLPAAMVYGYNLMGIPGKHNFRDRTIIYGTALAITSAIVIPTKHLVKEERPDGSNNLSFPSGHTAFAFASAQFLFREYQDTNISLAVSGYPVALFTGLYRMLNDKHWFGDVVGGAGIGILSTEMAYWLFPTINKWLSPKVKNATTMLYPFYQNKAAGLGFAMNF